MRCGFFLICSTYESLFELHKFYTTWITFRKLSTILERRCHRQSCSDLQKTLTASNGNALVIYPLWSICKSDWLILHTKSKWMHCRIRWDSGQPFTRIPWCCKVSKLCSNSVMHSHVRIPTFKWWCFDYFEFLVSEHLKELRIRTIREGSLFHEDKHTCSNSSLVLVYMIDPGTFSISMIVSIINERISLPQAYPAIFPACELCIRTWNKNRKHISSQTWSRNGVGEYYWRYSVCIRDIKLSYS